MKKQHQPVQQQPSQINNNHWFIVGNHPLIAAAELNAVLNLSLNDDDIENNIIRVNKEINAPQLINVIGGTIKIAKQLQLGLTKKLLETTIIDSLNNYSGKIVFGLSFYGDYFNIRQLQTFGIDIKKELKKNGKSVRYVQNREIILSSAVLVNNKLVKKKGEFIIYQKGEKFDLAITEAVQPIVQLSGRDYGRPSRDEYSGMLPPKLAMMMINLATPKKNKIILDPFCGSGTIITEAMLMGLIEVIGSDSSDKAIRDSQKNINWIADRFKLEKNNIKLYHCPIEDLESKLPSKSVHCIATEPYLGNPLMGIESERELDEQAKQLQSLYMKAFQQFKNILEKNGTILFILPKFKSKHAWVRIECLKDIKKLGFKTKPLLNKHHCLTYYRPGQKLAREIWRFTLT